MTPFTLSEAARTAKVSKSSIFRAVKSGRLSATRDDLGNYSIDAAELFRVFPERPAEHVMERSGTGEGTAGDEGTALRARLEAEIAGLKAILAERDRVLTERDRLLDEVRSSRDDWKGRAERLLAGPERRPWWRRLAG